LVGVLYLGSQSDDTFTDKDIELVRQVANGLALFVENALTHEALQGEKEGLQKLFEISRTFTPSLDAKNLLVEIANCTRLVFKQDYAYLALYDKAASVMRLSPLDSSDANAFIAKETSVPLALVLTRSSSGKLARLLLSLVGARDGEAREVRIQTPATHEEMAQRIGASRETVTRLVSDLRKKDLIRLDGSTLVIKNRTALEAMAV